MSLYLIRHTQTTCPEGICYGQADLLPNENFEIDKKLVRSKIKGIKFDAIYSSPLIRCRKLADFLFLEYNIQYDDCLKELNFGTWEMQSWDAIFNSQEGKAWFADYINVSTPEGESYSNLKTRVNHFYDSSSSISQNKNTAIVTHAGVIAAFMNRICKMEITEAFNKKITFGEVVKFNNPKENMKFEFLK